VRRLGHDAPQLRPLGRAERVLAVGCLLQVLLEVRDLRFPQKIGHLEEMGAVCEEDTHDTRQRVRRVDDHMHRLVRGQHLGIRTIRMTREETRNRKQI
jgi:hypothetical protein